MQNAPQCINEQAHIVWNHTEILTFQDSSQSHYSSNHKRKATTYSRKKMDQR